MRHTTDHVSSRTGIGVDSGVDGEARTRRRGYWLFGGTSSLLVLVLVLVLIAVGCAVLHAPHAYSQATPANTHAQPTPTADHSSQQTGPTEHPDDNDGDIPDGRDVTPFNTQYAAISHLQPDLLKAVQKADKDAQGDGITFRVTSGWRSRAHQRLLLDAAVSQYGSLKKAREFVNTPEKSTHVLGKAIDIGPTDADYWLIQHGARYGLCQIYSNEIWHFERRPTPGGVCPVPQANASD